MPFKEYENCEIVVEKDTEKILSDDNMRSLDDQSVHQNYNQTVDPTLSRNDQRISSRRCCYGSFRRWKHKHYTLIRDSDPENTELGLDTLIFFCSSGTICNSRFN